MKKVSFMSDLLETLRQEGVDPALLAAVEEYRAAHPLAEALRPRIPVSAFTYYGIQKVKKQPEAPVQKPVSVEAQIDAAIREVQAEAGRE